MKKILLLTILLSISLVGCSKDEKTEPMKVNVLESNKERETPIKNKQETENLVTNEQSEIINNNEETIEEIIEPFLTYNYLSTTKTTLKNNVETIDNYKDWLSFKNKNIEVYSLFTESPLQINEDYFNKNLLLVVGNKDFNLEKLIELKETKNNNNIMYFTISENMSIQEIENYDEIIESIPDFETNIMNQYLILSFNKKELKNISSYQIIQE